MRDYRQALTFSLNISCALNNENIVFSLYASNRLRPKQKCVRSILQTTKYEPSRSVGLARPPQFRLRRESTHIP